MLRVTSEHQQSRAAVAGGALAGLLEGAGRGCQGALQGRLQVLRRCGRGQPGVLQNSTVPQRRGLGTEAVLGEAGRARGAQPLLQTDVATSRQPHNFPLPLQSSPPPQGASRAHSGPTWEGNRCHARQRDHLLSTTHVKLSFRLLIIDSRSPGGCSSAQGL